MISTGMLFLCAIGLGWTVGIKDEPETHRRRGESLEQFAARVEATVHAHLAAMEYPEVQHERREANAATASG